MVKLRPGDFARALSSAAAVLADHSVALDRLDLGDRLDLVDGSDRTDRDGRGEAGRDQRTGISRAGVVDTDLDGAEPVDLAPSESQLSPSERSDDLIRGGSEPELYLEHGPAEHDAAGHGVTSLGVGTQLSQTLSFAVGSVADAAAASTASLSSLCSTLTTAAFAGAQGDAGADLAAVLGGFEEALRNADDIDGARMAVALELGAERLARADDGAHAGCFPAVAAAAADSALAAVDAGATLGDVLIAAADGGLIELEAGPVSNPGLSERGVVDAAAAGYLLLLDVLASFVTGEPLPSAPSDDPDSAVRVTGGRQYRISVDVEPDESSTLESAAWLESTWHEMGALESFRHGTTRWHGELVTTLPGAAIEALCEVGRPRELHISVVPAPLGDSTEVGAAADDSSMVEHGA